jgi:hypothetical protein
MSADELRNRSAELFETIKLALAKTNDIGSAQLSAQIHTMQACWEIAAQIAELREQMMRPL